MKISTIIRAIARPWVRIHNDDNDRVWFMFGPENVAGPGFGCASSPHRDWTARATVRQIGGLTVAWWGRDKVVHPSPEAS